VQPDWSELPVVVLLDRASPNARVRANLNRAWPRARLIFYQRPVTPVELISGVQSAMRARLRQRDVRDHIVREIELRRELNHRVKNILASVASIFQMTMRGAGSLEDFADDFGGRLEALAKVHSAVFHATDDAVPIGDIVDLTIEPYRHSGRERIVASGPEVVLKSNVATSLALCLHELATNAIKYGCLSVPSGQVSLQWEISEKEPQELSLRWTESGGPPVVEPAHSGYGMRYLKAALTSVFGEPPTILFVEAGLRCEVKGRLSRLSCNS
jgi:two-component sensor histidine kinase